jgi:hypothetical protein
MKWLEQLTVHARPLTTRELKQTEPIKRITAVLHPMLFYII